MNASRILGALLTVCTLVGSAGAQPQSPTQPAAPPQLAPVPKDCLIPGVNVAQDSPLPQVAQALQNRKRITILAIGGTSVAERGKRDRGYLSLVETFLENTFKGLDVTIVNRGVSGELARDAAERIKMEVALQGPDLVLWQLGTADALAHLSIEDFRSAVSETIDWLKDHKIDVALIGIRYARAIAKDAHYQAIRKTLSEVAREKNILRIGRYEAMETLQRIRAGAGEPLTDAELTETGYLCMSQYLARAIAAGLFAKPKGAIQPPARP